MIAVDWGTSSFRAYRLDSQGGIIEKREAPKGILSVEAGEFAQVLESEVGDWIAAGEAPVVMSGMVGSRQGWAEAPYVQCPAGLEELASSLKVVEWGRWRAWIVPGVTCRDEAGVRDVMRGEEVQILGALAEVEDSRFLVCLPGTHSKWVRVEDSKIAGFSTHMTGEVFAVLKSHSLLGRMMQEATAGDADAFADGVKRSGDAGGLLHHIFGVRTRGLFGELAVAASSSYLSGILIGHELRNAGASKVYFLGNAQLTDLYVRAATSLSIETRTLDPNSATSALFKTGQAQQMHGSR
jgi:2-dehydro-3-deoxygalactonokinase